jgi:hypothetical protein
MISGIVATVVGVAGCQTTTTPQLLAYADEQHDECKVVGLTSATQIMRSENQRGIGRDDIRQTEGTLEAGRLGLYEPRALSTPGAPHQSVIARMGRAC